ncbi:MAG: ABC transporter ATP-binding protein, partial [Myxococcota bacterium]
MNAWLAENLAGMRENHLYRAENLRRAEFRSLTDAHQASITHVIRAWGLLRPAMMMTSAIATSCVLMVGYERVVAGAVTVGVLLTFLQYTVRLWAPVRNLTEKFNQIQTALTAGERVMDILDAQARIFDLDRADPGLEVEQGRIQFDAVRFRYPRKKAEVLAGVEFTVEPGKMLALVGDTGAGKSTIARLITRQYDVTQGAVRVDDHDVRDYTLNQLRSGIAIVPQEVVIFAGSVRENITLGRDIADERIWECIRAVRADGLIERMSDGLDSPLEEGGRTLSTGERQLLSFAR